LALNFQLTIDCENDAFCGDTGQPSAVLATVEIARILEELAPKLARDGRQHGTLWDTNGNRVGKFEFVGSEGGQQRGKRHRA
jgi:hypothetical protein